MKWFISCRRSGASQSGFVLQQLDIEPVQPAGCLDVEGTLADLLDGRDSGKWQEKSEMIGKLT